MSDSPQDAAAPTEEAAADRKPKKGRKAALFAALLGLGSGAAGGVILLGPAIGSNMAESAPLAGAEVDDDGLGGGSEDSHGGGVEGGAAGADLLHIIDNLVVNPSDSEGTRFLLASVALEPTTSELGDELTLRDVELRDALLRVLGGKTVDELVDIGRRPALGEELKAAVEEIMGDQSIRRLFIPQYVIQ